MFICICNFIFICIHIFVIDPLVSSVSTGMRIRRVTRRAPSVGREYVYIYTYIYIYIYIERERDMYTYVYIYIYIYVYTPGSFCWGWCFHLISLWVWSVVHNRDTLGGTQTGSYQTGSYQKGRFIPPKPQLLYFVFFDATPFICL